MWLIKLKKDILMLHSRCQHISFFWVSGLMLHKSPVKTVSVEVDIRDMLVWFRRKHFRTMGEKNNLHSLIKKSPEENVWLEP